MSDIRDFHAALSRLAYAHASNTLRYILDEARQVEARVNAYRENHSGRPLVLWPEDMERVQTMLGHPNAAFVILRTDGTVLRCNDNLARPLGFSRGSTLLGRCMWELPTCRNVEWRRQELQRVLDGGRSVRTVDSNGHGKPIETFTIPLSRECAMIVYTPCSQRRVFEEAFHPDRPRIIE